MVIPAFAHDWLRRAVANCGFSEDRIIAIESGASVFIGDCEVRVFVADHCDPNTCGVQLPCHNRDPRMAAFDSIGVFSADASVIVNANDALAVASARQVLPILGKVDLLLGHYGGAGPFPQTFTEIPPEQKKQKAAALAEGFLRRLAGAAEATQARFVMPFAGQYVLGGRLVKLNDFRSVVSLSDALDWVEEHTSATAIGLAPFGTFDLGSGTASERWTEPDPSEIEDYLSKISKIVFPYEKRQQDWHSAAADLGSALESVGAEYKRRVVLGEGATSYRISLDADTVSGWIDFDGVDYLVSIGPLGPLVDQETRLKCHANLLRGLIQRSPGFTGFTPMHFNQAEIGSHFEWRRRGEFNEVIRCLNFMQVGRRRELAVSPA